MDVLSDILGAVRLKGTLYFSTEFRAPWGLRVPALQRVARFHLLVRGGCWVRVTGLAEPLWLEPGDLALIPNGAEHVLADTRDTPCRTVEEVLALSGFDGTGALTINGGDDGSPTRLVCGHFAFDDDARHPFLDQLPSAIVVRWDDYTRDSPLENAYRFIVREMESRRPGNEVVVKRLSEVLFVQAVRCWMERERQDVGVLAALADPQLGPALAAIHAAPEAAWTLASLGRYASMGRSAFATRFREVIGLAPMEYVTTWRLELAKRLITDTRLSFEQIASKVGYQSSASLSRVFVREIGERPGGYRRRVSARVRDF